MPLLLFAVRETVQESLGFSPAEAQSKMKINYDKKSVARIFQEGDRVLVLLLVVGSTLQAKFSGPYVVDQKLSETNYVIQTPDLQYTVMPFGLRNAPATFQRLMNTVLCDVSNCEVYLDDIVAYSSTWTEHMKTLDEIFDRLQAASLTLNLAKCEFGKAVVT